MLRLTYEADNTTIDNELEFLRGGGYAGKRMMGPTIILASGMGRVTGQRCADEERGVKQRNPLIEEKVR